MKAEAPRIPATKCELMSELAKNKAAIGDRAGQQALVGLNKDELKAIFCKEIRGEKHPLDPTQNLTTLKKAALQELNRLHGLNTQGNKGDLMLRVRNHWHQQCGLVTADGTCSETSQDWSLLEDEVDDPGAEITAANDIMCQARQLLEKASGKLQKACGLQKDCKPTVNSNE